MRNLIYIAFLLIVVGLPVNAGLPPTTTKGAGESSFKTTFNFSFPSVPLSRSGTTIVFPLVPVAGGGTGASTLTNHGVLLGQGTSAVAATAAGSSGQILRSGGASADPAYSTATYPSTAGTSGNVLTSDGTNFVSSAPAAGGVPVFAIYHNNSGSSGSGVIAKFTVDDTDANSIYSTSTGQVTVPSGKTFCIMRWYMTGDATNKVISCYKNGSKFQDASNNDTSGSGVQNGTCYVNVTTNDTLDIRANGALAGNANDNGSTACW